MSGDGKGSRVGRLVGEQVWKVNIGLSIKAT